MLRKFRMRVNGNEYLVEMEELTEGASNEPVATTATPTAQSVPGSPKQPATKPAPAPTANGNGEQVKAPMPGTILEILVQTGEAVSENQPVLILEAMKMENQIVSPINGTITGIAVQKGDAVDVDALLFTVHE
ncbi:MAG: biotin/lipoyl-containing protein [Aerococcus sp.]|nr:biotin/lipoyl-containing protein [Aerococcus sp.]